MQSIRFKNMQSVSFESFSIKHKLRMNAMLLNVNDALLSVNSLSHSQPHTLKHTRKSALCTAYHLSAVRWLFGMMQPAGWCNVNISHTHTHADTRCRCRRRGQSFAQLLRTTTNAARATVTRYRHRRCLCRCCRCCLSVSVLFGGFSYVGAGCRGRVSVSSCWLSRSCARTKSAAAANAAATASSAAIAIE